MKLSEAIRLGAMLAPQTIGGRTDAEGRCALAGACDVLGIASVFNEGCQHQEMDYHALHARFPVLLTKVPSPTDSIYGPRELRLIIWFLNDSLGWTREAIADWIETIEAQQPEIDLAAVSVEA